MHYDLPFFAVLLFVVDWVLRIFCLFYVPRGRRPSAATAWLITIFIIPTLGILLYLLIGSPKLSRRRRAIQKRINAIIAHNLPHDASQLDYLSAADQARIAPITDLAHQLTNVPVQQGNDVKLHTDYDATIGALTRETESAKHTIYLEFYIFAFDSTTKPLIDALGRAVERGVQVHVLFDAVGSHRYRGLDILKQTLTDIGVMWRMMLPLSVLPSQYNRPDLRNHRKIAVFDARVAFIGSINLIDKHYQRRDNIAYEELTAELHGPLVQQCAAIFAGDWYSETGQTLHPTPTPQQSIPEEGEGMLAQLVPSGPSYPYANNHQLFLSLLYTARKRVVITNPYFVPDEALLAAVVAAVKRGVEVVLINSEAKDQWMVAHAQRSYYTQLLRIGVKIYLHDSPVLLHAKHLTIDDDIAVIGSSNMDIRSFQLIMECVVVVYDRKLTDELQQIQERNLRRSRQVTLHQWQKRGVAPQLLDNLARLTADLQ